MHRPRIVVVGSSNMDMVVRTPRIPASGETVLGGDFLMAPGGKGANQAVAASRLGGDVTLVARVGIDLFGQQALAGIGAAGVITQYIVRDAEAPSGVALICVSEEGQNSIVVASGANARLTPGDVDTALPAFLLADVVIVQFETPLETVAHAVRLAKSRGKRVILNPAPMLSLPDDFLIGIDVITPNEHEAAMLLGILPSEAFDGEDAARALLGRGAGAAVVTLGAQGAAVASADELRIVPAFAVQALDTTAAGDCFTGALAVALGEGGGLFESVRFANAAAALSVTRKGAQPSMPTRIEVETFLTEGQ